MSDTFRADLIETTAEMVNGPSWLYWTTFVEEDGTGHDLAPERKQAASIVDAIITASLTRAAGLLTAKARELNPDPADWSEDAMTTFVADGLDGAAALILADLAAVTAATAAAERIAHATPTGDTHA
jgi:hypothetical protein